MQCLNHNTHKLQNFHFCCTKQRNSTTQTNRNTSLCQLQWPT